MTQIMQQTMAEAEYEIAAATACRDAGLTMEQLQAGAVGDGVDALMVLVSIESGMTGRWKGGGYSFGGLSKPFTRFEIVSMLRDLEDALTVEDVEL